MAIDTYTTEQVMLLSGLKRRGVYAAALRYDWTMDVEKEGYQKRYDAGKVAQYLQARAITKQAQLSRGYGATGALLWPVTTCPICKKPAAFMKTSIFCIEGHYTER